MLTSLLLVKIGFLDSNLLRTFGGPNEVRFRWSWVHFKYLEVSYNFPRNSLLQKMHEFFIIPKIPLESQNCQKLTSSKLIQKPPSCIFSSQTPSKLSQNHKISDFDLSCLKFIKDSKNAIFHFWCEMTNLPFLSFLLVFAQFLSFVHI